ncbi:MAG: hypothetical protein U9R25_00935 [Chloroflexota bacterium]|nr:hypothetical protein [Chloroflexota bacterium]
MTHATRWRQEFVRSVADAYRTNPKIAAISLAGSVARGWADRHSDIELDVFWSEPPDDAERSAILQAAGSAIDINWNNPPGEGEYRDILLRTEGHASQIWPYEDLEWSEHFYVRGVNIGVSAFLANTMESWLTDVVDDLDVDDNKHILLSSVQNGQPCFGVDLLSQWKARINYSDELAAAVVKQQLEVNEAWWRADMLAEREAHIPLYDLFSQMQKKLLRLLLASNRIFLPDPRFKWAQVLIARMTVAPQDLQERLRMVFWMDYRAAVAEMQALYAETLALVERAVPGVETEFARAWLSFRRAVWDEPPPAS